MVAAGVIVMVVVTEVEVVVDVGIGVGDMTGSNFTTGVVVTTGVEFNTDGVILIDGCEEYVDIPILILILYAATISATCL